MKLAKVQCTIPQEMHENLCLLADKQGIGVATLYKNCMMNWYEKNWPEKSIFWEVKR